MRVGDAIRRLLSPGSYILVLFFLAGIWLTISPFVMTTQPSGQHWMASTITNVTIGAILVFVSLSGILGYIALAARELMHETKAKQETDRQTTSS